MRPVFQDQFGYGSGNCAWACIASIMECEIDDLGCRGLASPTDPDIDKLTELRWPGLESRHEDCAYDFEMVAVPLDWGGDLGVRWTYKVPGRWTPPTQGHWMASIFSPGLTRPKSDPYYPLPALHAVVMRGAEKVHDPHPDYADTELLSPVVMKYWWEPRDLSAARRT